MTETRPLLISRLNLPLRVGLAFAIVAMLLAVVGIVRGNVPLNPVSILLALLISGGQLGGGELGDGHRRRGRGGRRRRESETTMPVTVANRRGVAHALRERARLRLRHGRRHLSRRRGAAGRRRLHLGPTAAGVPFLFMTNNSTTPAAKVVDRLARMGIAARSDEVITSADVTAGRTGARDAGGRALVVGEEGIRRGPVRRTASGLVEDHREADVVVVGMDRQLTYARLQEAALAVRRGAALIATNVDRTLPTRSARSPAPARWWPPSRSRPTSPPAASASHSPTCTSMPCRAWACGPISSRPWGTAPRLTSWAASAPACAPSACSPAPAPRSMFAAMQPGARLGVRGCRSAAAGLFRPPA